MTLEVAAAGPASGPLVILLHGFPDVWQGWRHQIAPLLSAGFRVLAPNQRGYGRSDKPQSIAAYDLDRLADDVFALAETEGRTDFQLVGHDWGGIIAWWCAARDPQRVRRLVVINAPHPGIVRSYLASHPTQILKSWYVAFFQLPWLPEAVLRWDNFAALWRAVSVTSLPGDFDAEDHADLEAAWSQPGALTAMLNYYRALTQRTDLSCRRGVTPPALILFSRDDPAEEPGLAIASEAMCDQAQLRWYDNARHWLQRSHASRVNQQLLTFLTRGADG